MSSTLSQADIDNLIEELSEFSLQFMWTLRQEAMRAFEPLGLRPVKALLLELIGRGMIHPKELAEILDTVPPAISSMLTELETQDLLARAIDPNDRRRVILQLTEKGQAMRQQLKEAWYKTGVTRLKRLSPEDLAALIRIYRKIVEEA